MHNAAVSNSFLISKSSRVITELLTRGNQLAAGHLITVAERAYQQRDLKTLREASALLLSFPGSYAQSAGLWFQALADKRAGNLERSFSTLEHLIANSAAAPRFRARALRSIGTIFQERGELETAALLYSESARFIRYVNPADLFGQMKALMLLSAVQDDQRDPETALYTLAQVRPIVEAIADPVHTAIFCNNAAVELLQLGRIQEAALYSGAALALPFARAYPEWQATALEIEKQAREKAARNRNLRPAVEQARKTSPKSKLRLVKKPRPVALPTSTRRRIGPVAIIRPEQPRSRPTLEQLCLKIRIRAPSF